MFHIKSNQRAYLLLCCTYFLVGGLLLLLLHQGDEILYFDARRTTFGDVFFKIITRLGEEIPYVLVLLLFLFQRQYIKALGVPALALTVTTVSYLLKTFFAQARPGRFFQTLGHLEQMNLVEGVKLNMGLTSFPSGHTLSAFALTTFIVVAARTKSVWTIFFFLLAVLVAVSRIYLVQHFLRDVYFGAAVGLLLGWLWAYVVNKRQKVQTSPVA
ncbi:MAG: phosphatase PAP2 family protein [Saprospiraceae bacterium]|nr:phosphatase PAP2 family protein [Saprospiraceae bacterium]